MKTLATGILAILGLAGCVVHVHERHRQPPSPPPPAPPPPPVTTRGGVHWTHVRYVVWTEYYGCSEDEVVYLENCGYDDDDLLVLCFIARRARVPVRYVMYEYDRCGRSLYTVAMVFRLDPFAFFCEEVPRGYACPPPYGRAYGYYWRREPVFLSDDECRALVQLHIGVRYYGYTSVAYFQEFERCRGRGEPPFRTIVVRDHVYAGRGGRSCDDRPVVKRDRPWEHRDPHEWERRRQEERERMKAHWARRQEEEEQRIRREAEAQERRRAVEEARRHAEELRRRREEMDRRGGPEAGRGPKGPQEAPGDKDPRRPPSGPPGHREGRGPSGPDREEGPKKPPGGGGKEGPGKKDEAGPKAHSGPPAVRPEEPPEERSLGGGRPRHELARPKPDSPGEGSKKPVALRREGPPAPPKPSGPASAPARSAAKTPPPVPPKKKAPPPASAPAQKKESGGDSLPEKKDGKEKD